MKAHRLKAIGELNIEDVEKPVPKKNEVIVKVKACGICGSDIPRAYKEGAHVMPITLGHEFSGEVEELGESVDRKWAGKRVGIFPLIPCKKCEPCQNKQYEMCKDYSYLGSRQDGGFAEYVAVPEWNLIELPDNVGYEEAAMLEPMAVAVHALRKIQIDKKDTVVVCGLGTIGLFLTMFLKERKIDNIYVVGNKDIQKEAILRLGLPVENFCDIRIQNASTWIAEKTRQNGVDAFFECVGKEETYALAIESTKPVGKVCVVGNPQSNMVLSKNTYWKILRNQLEITGTWNSSFTHEATDDWHYVVDRLEKKKINPAKFISHKFMIDDVKKGFEIMRDKKEEYIKVMVNME